MNEPQTEAELEAIRRSLERGHPYGIETRIKRAADRLGLAITLRPRGRPRRQSEKGS